MQNNERELLAEARAELLAEHTRTSKYIARLALTSSSKSLSFKLKLAKLYKYIFSSK